MAQNINIDLKTLCKNVKHIAVDEFTKAFRGNTDGAFNLLHVYDVVGTVNSPQKGCPLNGENCVITGNVIEKEVLLRKSSCFVIQSIVYRIVYNNSLYLSFRTVPIVG
jgi:hypothetical protein